MSRQFAFTLLECLCCLLLVAILSSMAWPSFQRFHHRRRSEHYAKRLQQSLRYARAMALHSGAIVSVCFSRDGQRCDGDTTAQQLIFVDHNANHRLDPGERLLRTQAPLPAQWRLSLRAFGSHKGVQFLPSGRTRGQNGRFTLCGPSTRQAVIFAQSGLSRVASAAEQALCTD